MKTLKAYSSNGEISFNNDTGEVIEIERYADTDSELPAIVKIDVKEWCKTYPNEIMGDVDILDVGYWIDTGEYEPPVEDWRKECLQEFDFLKTNHGGTPKEEKRLTDKQIHAFSLWTDSHYVNYENRNENRHQ